MPKPINPLTGKAESNGTSILDVTDPASPKYLAHIPGAAGHLRGGRRADGARLRRQRRCRMRDQQQVLPAAHLRRRRRTKSGTSTDPAKPVLVTRIDGLKDTHKSWWECDTGIAYLVSGAPDWRTRRMTQIYDLSDPAQPVNIRDFGLPGQQPGATGPVPTDLHGPISTGPQGNRVYFGYGTNKGGVLQIVDREKLLKGPKEPTPENLLYPQSARLDDVGLRTARTRPFRCCRCRSPSSPRTRTAASATSS